MNLPNISLLNKESFENFNDVISILFEPAPPLATELYAKRPFLNYNQLLNVAHQIISSLPMDDQIIVVNAHPRLGEKKLSTMSAMEQGKILEVSDIDHQLALLNQAYEDKHGFKFITFVNGRSRHDILPEIKERIYNETGLELKSGILVIITHRFRCNDLYSF